MNQKTVLTPMQLFFCAKLMDAVYYDYAYLAAMPDVQKEYALHEQETMEELEDQGIHQGTIRLSIGTENINDILADLEQAFN